jgi:nucleotide-binding universal stress UspA family protein
LGTYLLAYDHSESAQKALARTLGLVSPRDLVVLVWVVPSSSDGPMTSFAVEEEGDRARRLEKLNEAVALVKREGRQAAALLLEGPPAETIVATGDRLGADLIILGHAGVSHIGPLRLGSVAERVAELSNCRVLIVK